MDGVLTDHFVRAQVTVFDFWRMVYELRLSGE
jgi:hypothetical protein